MSAVVVVGSLNCDLVMRVARRPSAGETVKSDTFDVFVGGKGTNQAIACARAGASVAFVGRVGNDAFGDKLLDVLSRTGVDTRFVTRDPELSTGVAQILVDHRGENSIAVAPQANGRLSADHVAGAEEAFAAARLLLLALEIPVSTATAAARLAKAHGLCVVLNPAPAPPDGKLPSELLANVDILIPNQSEAELLTGVSAGDVSGAMRAARALSAMGVGRVVVTLGSLGCVVFDAGIEDVLPAVPVEVVDSTGAGDAFCGVLAAALSRDEGLLQAAQWANLAGALACTRRGAEPSLPSDAEIREWARQISPALLPNEGGRP